MGAGPWCRLRAAAHKGSGHPDKGASSGVVPYLWHDSHTIEHDSGSAAARQRARDCAPARSDAALVDEALEALLRRHRSAEVDASYAAYDEHPLDERDEWGDLASFRRAAAAS